MIRNTSSTWGAVSRLFHWAAAALVLYLIVHGFWMTEFAAREGRFGNYQTHASVGYGLIAFMLLRLLWRWGNTVPELPAATARWERIAAHAGHWGLYLLTLASALSGWALAGTMRRPLDSFFGLFNVPALVSGGSRGLHDMLEETHAILSWTLALLVLVHIASAIYHWRWKKDDVMQRMLR
jgi:cytochrome b561